MAQKNSATLKTDLNTRYPDNIIEDIEPSDVRVQQIDMVDSFLNKADTAAQAIQSLINYGTDLSSTFTDRSLVDKAYADSIIPQSTKFVLTENQYPDAVSGIRTLEANTTYILFGTVSTADTIEFSSGSKLMGLDRFSDFASYTGSGDQFTYTGTGSFQIEDLGLSASSGTVFNLVGDGTQTMVLTNSYILNCSKVGTIDGIRTISFRSFSLVAATDVTNGGLIIKSTTPGDCEEFNMSDSLWQGVVAGNSIDIQATSMLRINIGTGNRINAASGVVGIKGVASNGNFSASGVGIISGDIFEGAGTRLSNITKSDTRWNISSCIGIQSSSQNAQGYYHESGTPSTTTIAAADTAYPINVGTAFVDDHSDQFEIDNDGTVRYIGIETKEFKISMYGNGTASTGTNQIFEHYIALDTGAGFNVQTGSKTEREFSAGSNGTFSTGLISELSTNDEIKGYVLNRGSTNDWDTNILNIVVIRA